MRSIARVVVGSVVAIVVTALAAGAQESDAKAQAELASALTGKHVSLQTGLANAASKGRPISAKYEYEDGTLKLSVYTEKTGAFFEASISPRLRKGDEDGENH